MKLFSKKNNEISTVIDKIKAVEDVIPSADIMNFFNNLTEAYREGINREKEIAQINAKKEVMITEISRKYDLYNKVFDRIFEERSVAIKKSFEIIDKGIKEGDNESISIGLNALSKVVSSSPFSNIGELSKVIEQGGIIEI